MLAGLGGNPRCNAALHLNQAGHGGGVHALEVQLPFEVQPTLNSLLREDGAVREALCNMTLQDSVCLHAPDMELATRCGWTHTTQ